MSGPEAGASGETPPGVRVVDLTRSEVDRTIDESKAEPSTVLHQREGVRRMLAIGLLIVLAALVAAWGLVAVFCSSEVVDRTTPVFQTVFAGVLALTGTVVGFYFGSGDS